MYFLTFGIWKVDTDTSINPRMLVYRTIKSFILAYRNLDWSLINTRAGALTYNTLLSIVPLLAVLFAIARGFGFQNIVQSELFEYFEGHQELMSKVMGFIDKSLEYAQGGVFVGVGIVFLLYTVLNLMSIIEDNFNSIWRIKKGRSYYRQFTDYVALLLITPILLACNAGLSIIISASAERMFIGMVIDPFVEFLPFFITILLFTFLYAYIPNTKVKLRSAFFAGLIAGILFQIFQQIYIGGQIWISKYNAIYGSFAALPLLLLWMQLSWLITLIGVELCFAHQNVGKFSFEKETKNISRRYKDFVILLITTLIIKRFETGEKPLTANDISTKYRIPTRLTSDIIYLLQEINIIIETPSGNHIDPAYIPALDIHKISASYLFDKVDMFGSEDFNIDIDKEFANEWNLITEIRTKIREKEEDILIKDL
jgi:membrane protein